MNENKMTVEQVGRVRIRKHGNQWLIKRYVQGKVFIIYTASNFNPGITSYMDMRRRDW